MPQKNIPFILFLAGLILVLSVVSVDAGHKYIGNSKCKTCHKLEKYGNQHEVWEKSRHARAYETLGTAKAKESAKKHGIDDPRKSPECLKCHVTAYDVPVELKTAGYKMEEGVSCEECHGPGSDYKKIKIMRNREEAIKNGLVIGDKKTCLKCHVPEGNDFYVEFDFEKFMDKIKHPTSE